MRTECGGDVRHWQRCGFHWCGYGRCGALRLVPVRVLVLLYASAFLPLAFLFTRRVERFLSFGAVAVVEADAVHVHAEAVGGLVEGFGERGGGGEWRSGSYVVQLNGCRRFVVRRATVGGDYAVPCRHLDGGAAVVTRAQFGA